MNEKKENPFIIDDLPVKENSDASFRLKRQWDIHMIFGTEPRLAVIAVDAATVKWLWKKARIAAFRTALYKADKLIGEGAQDPRLRDEAAWDCFHDYILEHLRL